MGTGLQVFDTTVQETNAWLADVGDRLGGDREDAYAAVRASLHALRDRLPAEMVLALSAQLPMLMRGLFLEGWRIAGSPTNEHTIAAFKNRVEAELSTTYPFDGATAARAVFHVLTKHVSAGLPEKLIRHLPEELRSLWPQPPVGATPDFWR